MVRAGGWIVGPDPSAPGRTEATESVPLDARPLQGQDRVLMRRSPFVARARDRPRSANHDSADAGRSRLARSICGRWQDAGDLHGGELHRSDFLLTLLALRLSRFPRMTRLFP